MYIADDENSNIRSLNTTLDFSKTIDIENVKKDMIIESKVDLKTIECRVLNGRKINLKAIIDLELKILSNEELEFVEEVQEKNNIQLLDNTLYLNSMVGSGDTKVYAKDTLVFDNANKLSEIMKVDFSIINEDTKISYNKVLIKADANVKIMYLTDDNRICSISQLIPIMGFVDIQDVNDENLCSVNYELKNIIVKPNSIEEHSVYVEAEIEITCNAMQSKQINIIQDLYSPSMDLVYSQRKVQAISQMQIVKDIYSYREKQFIEEIGNHKIYDVEVKPSIITKKNMNNHIMYEGQIELNFIFDSDNSAKIDIKNIIIPFTFEMDCNEVNPLSNVETKINVILQDFTVMKDSKIDMKIDLEFIAKISNSKFIQVIDEITAQEMKKSPHSSLIIYFVKPGDTLWNIAKKFRSTVNDIVKINDIEDENKINIGQQLFIPNYCEI